MQLPQSSQLCNSVYELFQTETLDEVNLYTQNKTKDFTQPYPAQIYK